MKIDFDNRTDEPISHHELEQHLELILRRLGSVGTVEIELAIVKDKEIQTLNNQQLGHDYPTDVLSFPADELTQKHFLGSIVISIDTAKRQAKQAGISLIKELKMLSGHGLLHLLGYHHL